ncbi:MAG: RDD family protein [Candidatus Eremiobacteraeota bacterium]|nr:RDD family protein [Candidatus Eremiobacteraeota bacterium]
MKQRAGFGPRLVALVIDMLLLGAISCVFGLMAGSLSSVVAHKVFHLDAAANAGPEAIFASGLLGVGIFLLVTALVATFLSLPYNLMEAFFGWTPGKLVMGLRVRNEDGALPSLGQVFSRWLIKHNAILIALLTFIGLAPAAFVAPLLQAIVFGGCFMALGAGRQALHDQMAHTAVYEVSELQAHSEDNSVL